MLLLGGLLVGCGNAGTPLMWATMLHLLIGNAIIGWLEGVLVGQVFHEPKPKAVNVFILANYFSAWVGGLMVLCWGARLDLDLYSGRWFIWGAGIAFFIVTIFLEWPVITWLFRQREQRWRISFRASLLAQCASYALIASWYLLVSSFNLYAKVQVDASRSFVANQNALVYYIGRDGHAYRQRLGAPRPEFVAPLASSNKDDRLTLVPSTAQGRWDLVALMYTDADVVHTNMILRACAAHGAQPAWKWRVPTPARTWLNFGPAVDLRPATERLWEVRTGFWAGQGLEVQNTTTMENIRLALETPFLQWVARNATVLPHDEIVFQLDGQICVFNRPAARLGQLASGRGPVVVMPE